jgi:hypothetical protein
VLMRTVSFLSLCAICDWAHDSCLVCVLCHVAVQHEGRLYLLVTDQGYQYEDRVVWERLEDVSAHLAVGIGVCLSVFERRKREVLPPSDSLSQ